LTPTTFDRSQPEHRRFRAYTERDLHQIRQLDRVREEDRFAMRVVATVLPFRVNQYVIDKLIDWDNIPQDPLYQLTFPQPGMLEPENFERMAALIKNGGGSDQIKTLADEIRKGLNPHPGEQQRLNVPRRNGQIVEGIQHKYRDTILFFPSHGQTCHSYCTFCFRWAQFVGKREWVFSSNDTESLRGYLETHPEITDLILSGGDPLVMKTQHLERYLSPLFDPGLEHLRTIRIGTKALTYWPHRFLSDPDADDLLRLMETIANSGRHVSLMAHYNHWRELETDEARQAIRRIRDTGAVIRSQGPLLAHINDDSETWARLWQSQVELGIVPYYMFVERDTGARRYFQVPLVRAYQIYREAAQRLSGLGLTARGPSMSAGPGKVEVQGIADVGGEKVFVLRFIRARNPDWVQRPFFARYNSVAAWLHDLRPAFGENSFFFEEEYQAMLASVARTSLPE
jgi:KamA family protein